MLFPLLNKSPTGIESSGAGDGGLAFAVEAARFRRAWY
jgi:hypothetical protein